MNAPEKIKKLEKLAALVDDPATEFVPDALEQAPAALAGDGVKLPEGLVFATQKEAGQARLVAQPGEGPFYYRNPAGKLECLPPLLTEQDRLAALADHHPLAQFIELDGVPRAPTWVVPGFIAAGVLVIAGTHGVGKTTCMLPLAMTVAGLHRPDDPLAPVEWRHVVYVTEDADQAQRILAGVLWHSGMGVGIEAVRERLHVVPAQRLAPEFVAKVAPLYRQRYTRTVNGVELLPLIVFDTKSATFHMEDENSNAEAATLMAVLKQDFGELPLWIIGHVPKADMSRSDAAAMSSRGAGAIDGDANQTAFLIRDGEERYLVLGKKRFDPEWPELHIRGDSKRVPVLNQWGRQEMVTLRWGVPTPPEMPREQAREQAQEQARQEAAAELRQAVLEAVALAWQTGNPLNREGVKAKLPKKRNEVSDCIECLIAEQWLHEVPVPAKQRTHPRRASFLVALTTPEHDAVTQAGEPIPVEKLTVPATWRKPISSVPEPEAENGAGGPV